MMIPKRVLLEMGDGSFVEGLIMDLSVAFDNGPNIYHTVVILLQGNGVPQLTMDLKEAEEFIRFKMIKTPTGDKEQK